MGFETQMMNSHSENSVDLLETCDLLDSKEGKAKKNWKKAKWHLVEYQKLPVYLRDNEYIVGYYRSEWPLKQILLSIFSIHNETLNVWTNEGSSGCASRFPPTLA